MKILKLIDQYGWAYFFMDREQQRYSKHDILIRRGDVDLSGVDIVFIHSPDISSYACSTLPNRAHRAGIKVIGCYSGQVNDKYSYADLIVTISPQTYEIAKSLGYSCPVVLIPEGVDTNFFYPSWSFEKKQDSFKVGWAGRPCAVKRPHLLDRLEFPVQKQADWGHVYFKEDRALDSMLTFYRSIDCLVLTSIKECMPRVVMEAMACGLPVVSTDVGSIRNLLSSKMIIPNYPDENLIVDHFNIILRLLENSPEDRLAIGVRNREHIENNFNTERLTAFWDYLFELIVSGKATEETIKLAAHNFGVPCLK